MKYSIVLEEIVKIANQRFAMISKDDWEIKQTLDSWSKKQILGHLIDSAYNNHHRFIKVEQLGNLIFEGYDQLHWVIKNDYQSRDYEEIIVLWTRANLHLAHLMNQFTADTLTKKTKIHNLHLVAMNPIAENAEVSFAYFIWDYIFHVEHHLSQIIIPYQNCLKKFGGSR